MNPSDPLDASVLATRIQNPSSLPGLELPVRRLGLRWSDSGRGDREGNGNTL